MADSSATVIIIFIIFLLMAGGGTAAWYFLYYKPRQGPSPAPAYVSAPIVYTTTPPSIPSPTTDGDEGDGDEGDGDEGDGDEGDLDVGEDGDGGKGVSKKFNFVAWKIRVKNDLKDKRPAVITKRIDRLKDAQTKKLSIKDGVPRSKYNEAIKWLRVLEKGAKKPKAKDRKPKAKDRKPKAKDRKPKAKDRKPKAKDRKPKAKARK